MSAACAALRLVRSLAAAVLARALRDLLKGRETAEILSWVQGCPGCPCLWMACHWLDISPTGYA